VKRNIRLAALAGAFVLFMLPLRAAPASPAITFESNRVTANGFHAGREVILFGVGTAPGPYFVRQLQYTQTLTADANGSVSYEIADGVPRRSVWFAVDAQTRDYAVAAPATSAARPLLAPPASVAGSQGATDLLSINAELADVLIVRPGVGVWTGSCGRNSRKDGNRGKSGAMHLPLDQIASTSKTKGHPDVILPSDLIIVVDGETLLYYAGNLAGH
jgi:hypothetical protein